MRDTVYAGFSFSSHACVVWICLESADRQGLGYACCFSTAFLGDVSLYPAHMNASLKVVWKFVSRSKRDSGRKNPPRTTPPPFCLQHIVWSTFICSMAVGSIFSVFTKFMTS